MTITGIGAEGFVEGATATSLKPLVALTDLSELRPPDDRRVAELEAAVAVPGTKVLTIDCFDTVLWRRTMFPVDVFTAMGEELIARGALASGLSAQDFRGLRQAAEAQARIRRRRHDGSVEVNLERIYEELPAYVSPLSKVQLADLEVEFERRLTVPDHRLCHTISRLAQTYSLQLVIVSDFYMSADQLRILLDRDGAADVANATILTSADLGIGKENGLWGQLPEMLQVSPSEIVHIGNNVVADFERPLNAGVRAVFWNDMSSRLKYVVQAELGRMVDGRLGTALDNGLTALRSRAAFTDFPGLPQDEPFWQSGVEIMGPVMVGYTDWVLERTRELGIDTALCIMREGRLIKNLVDAAQVDQSGGGLNAEVLWASRTALTRVLLANASREQTESLLSQPRPASIAGAAELLGIDLDLLPQFKALAHAAPHLAEDASVLRMLLDAVWASPELLSQFTATAQRRSRNFVRYLRELLGGRTGDIALLDIGWQGSNQERLQQILDREGMDVRLHGLYLMADGTPLERLLRGHRIEGFVPGHAQASQRVRESFIRNRTMLETLMLSNDGTTLEVDADGRPICADNFPSHSQARQLGSFQDGIRAYQQSVLDYRGAEADPDLGRIAGLTARAILERFVCEPTPEEAQVFGAWTHDDTHGNIADVTLIPTQDAWARRLSDDALERTKWERVWWAAGASVVWGGRLPGNSGPPLSPMGALRVDMVRSGGNAAEQLNAALDIGRDGLAIGRLDASGSNLEGLRIMPSLCPGLLRLDGLELWLRTPTNGWRQLVWSWQRGRDGEDRLTLSEAAWAGSWLMQVHSGSVISIALERALPSPCEVSLEFRGGFLPSADIGARIEVGPDGRTASLNVRSL